MRVPAQIRPTAGPPPAAAAPAVTRVDLAAIVAFGDRLAGATNDLDQVLQVAVEGVAGLIGDGAVLWLGDERGDEPVGAVRCHHRAPRAKVLLEELVAASPAAPVGGLTDRVHRTGHPLLLREVSEDVEGLASLQARDTFARYRAAVGLGSLAVLPLVVRRHVVGVLTICRDGDSTPLTESDLPQLCDLAGRVAMAVDNARLVASARLAEAVMVFSSDAVMVADRLGETTFVSPALARMLGTTTMPRGREVWDRVHPEDLPELLVAAAAADRQGVTGRPYVFRLRRDDGEWRWMEGISSDARTDDAIRGFVITMRDITERRRAVEALDRKVRQQAAVSRLGQRALTGESVGDLLSDALSAVAEGLDTPDVFSFEVTGAGDSARLVAGLGRYADHRGLKLPFTELPMCSRAVASQHPVVIEDIDSESRLPTETLRAWGAATAIAVPVTGAGGGYGGLVVTSTRRLELHEDDVPFLASVAHVLASAIDRSRSEAATRRGALHDPLTGLPNRTLLEERVQRAIDGAGRRRSHAALLLLDLDGFKHVNDSLGHHTGDELLQRVAERLTTVVRSRDTVARLGGDEFAVCIDDLAEGELELVVRRVLAAFDEPWPVAGMALPLSASVGVAVSPGDGTSHAVLVRRADAAMYAAKAARSGWARYADGLDEQHARRLAVMAELGEAIDADQLRLEFQPIVRLSDGAPVYAEALLRWQHPVRGLIPPGEFVLLAEQSGSLGPLTRWVLRAALSEVARWHAEGYRVPVSVNMSGTALADPQLPDTIGSLLAEMGVDPSLLVVEVTESAIVPAEAHQAVARLAATGVAVAVDDFGTGWSSLASLKQLPVRSLKLDRAFVVDLSHDHRDSAIVRSVVELAHTLGLDVVAEGVEREPVADMLRELGVDAAQGHLFARPQPPEQFRSWLNGR